MTLTIDTTAITHRIRLLWWKVAQRWLAAPSRCTGCGAGLTANERHYYGSTCELCELDWMRKTEEAERS